MTKAASRTRAPIIDAGVNLAHSIAYAATRNSATDMPAIHATPRSASFMRQRARTSSMIWGRPVAGVERRRRYSVYSCMMPSEYAHLWALVTDYVAPTLPPAAPLHPTAHKPRGGDPGLWRPENRARRPVVSITADSPNALLSF